MWNTFRCQAQSRKYISEKTQHCKKSYEIAHTIEVNFEDM